MVYDADGNDKPQNSKPKNIGGIWQKDGRGGPFLSGQIMVDGQQIHFVAFRNKYKEEGDNRPDWTIMPPRDQQSKPQRAPKPEPEAQGEEETF